MMFLRPGLCVLFSLVVFQVKAINAVVAHTIFYQLVKGTNNYQPVVETYWEVNPSTIHYTTNADKKIIGRIRTDIFFSRDTGIVSEDHFILQTKPCSNVQELGRQSIMDLHHFALPTGLTRLRLVLTDIGDTTNRFVYTDSLSIEPTPVDSMFYSGLQLLDTTIASGVRTPFEKNGVQQIPVSTNFLDEPKHWLHYYFELYKSDKVQPIDYPLVQKVSIVKKEGDFPVGNFKRIDTIKTSNKTLPFAGDFDIRPLESGNYYLSVTIENNLRQVLATRSLFFQRLNLHPLVDTVKKKVVDNDTGLESVNVLDLNKTFVAKYNYQQVRAILKMLLPFVDNNGANSINGFLKKPDDLYTRYFIYNYFANINREDPTRAWKEFTEKIIVVNKLFTAHGMEGYETERGFIYLRYGAPTEVVTVENEQGSLPYEIWTYNTLTQLNRKAIADAVFLFYRPTEADDYRLLQSTVSGEVQNPSWRRYLYVNAQAGGLTNSRAEQYLGK